MKSVQRILFSRNNPYPQKKVLTLTRHKDNFEFNINYANLSNLFNSKIIAQIGSLNISKVSLKNVSQCLSTHSQANKEYKGIKSHFRMDESGVLNLDEIETVFEAKVEEVVENATESGNTVGKAFANIGNTISKLFGKMSSEEKNETAQPSEGVNNNLTVNESMTKQINESLNNLKKSEAKENQSSETKTEIKIKTIKEPVYFETKEIDLPSLSQEEFQEWSKEMEELNAKEVAKQKRDLVKNALESFLHETKMRLYESEFEAASTEEEREKILKQLNIESEWLEYESDNAETDTFSDKLSSLKMLVKDVFERVHEHRERPEAINALNDMLNLSRTFFTSAQQMASTDQVFTQVELDTLETLLNSTQNWLNEAIEEQNQVALYETPKLSVKLIKEKVALLDREIKYMLNKIRLNPPKVKSSESESVINEEGKDKDKDKDEDDESENETSEDKDSKGVDKDNKDKDRTLQLEDVPHSQPLPSKTNEKSHTEL